MLELLGGTPIIIGGVVLFSALGLGIYAVTKPASIMHELLGGTAIIIGGVVLFSALGLGIYAVTKPASIAIDNRAFHESQAFNDGMAKDLGNFQLEYIRTDDQGKRAALRAVILDRFAGYDDTRLPPNLRNFLNTLKTGG